jgi:hypothetical protein
MSLLGSLSVWARVGDGLVYLAQLSIGVARLGWLQRMQFRFRVL